MVITNNPDKQNRLTISKAPPLTEIVEGVFAEGAVYNFQGSSYAIEDLPEYVKIFTGFVIESYLKLKE